MIRTDLLAALAVVEQAAKQPKTILVGSGEKIRYGDNFEKNTIANKAKFLRKTRLKESPWSTDETEDRHMEVEGSIKNAKVHPKDLRATQSWVDTRWKPSLKNSGPIMGLRTEDGKVHLLDGHHRADFAHQSKKPISVKVFDWSKKNERDFRKGNT
jgi:hypothetical protein